MKRTLFFSLFFLLFSFDSFPQGKWLNISGVYPHLAVWNPMDKSPAGGGECGIGAIVPWNNSLWLVTYSPHQPQGSADRLWTIDEQLTLTDHPLSIGGTPANRMIHRESEQLIIGPYFISKAGAVRLVPYEQMPGRHTATARHLSDPANRVYFIDMEGKIYEVDVNTLQSKLLFEKPVPGWHGKGGYTAQGRLIISNNGEHQVFDIKPGLLQAGEAPRSPDEMGCLAEWDGSNWKIIERRQFTDVTGPGGIFGNSADSCPAWSIGWDRRSVILKLLDHGIWHTFRLPKATNAYDHWGGWYTEWPRIRQITNGKYLMDMHGMFYDFPPSFSATNFGGLTPLCSHLRYVPDFCEWNGQLVLATDETSIIQNPMAGRSWSNLWFGSLSQLAEWGPRSGYGGPWSNDTVTARQPSDPFLINGFDRVILHLTHNQNTTIDFQLEISQGNGVWQAYKTLRIPPHQYKYELISGVQAQWIRLVVSKNCRATAMFHVSQAGYAPAQTGMFAGLARAGTSAPVSRGIIRPAGHNLALQFLTVENGKEVYYEVDEHLNFTMPASRAHEVGEVCAFSTDFWTDEASVVMQRDSLRLRLPKSLTSPDSFFTALPSRGIRELESERYAMNICGTFYEMPREAGLSALRPIASHNLQIADFCTWRGLLVLSGVNPEAENTNHLFHSPNRKSALWFGAIDDIWKLGKPTGKGGPWKNTTVKANTPSDPYLMTNYDRKTLTISTDRPATITIEVNVDHRNWYVYSAVKTKAGKPFVYVFPQGYNAHWIRFKADRDCVASAVLTYE